MPIVMDNPVFLSWCLADEHNPLAELAMQLTIEEGAVVPAIWWYELRNALVVNERRGRLDADGVRATLVDLEDMRIVLDADHDSGMVLELARRHGLSVYDASYLEVALRQALPLATLDQRLREAVAASGGVLVEEDSA